jgi:hypothetical protein
MGYYIPWKSISEVWSAASQIWKDAWYVEDQPPQPPAETAGGTYTAGALDPKFQTPWANWIENQKRKKYKRKIELACVVNGIEFKQEKDSTEEVVIGFKVNTVSLTETPSLPDIQLNEVRVQLLKQE